MQLLPLPAHDEGQACFLGVVAQALLGCCRLGRSTGRLRVGGRLVRELEVARPVLVIHRAEDADDVSVAKGQAPLDPLELAAPTNVRPVDAPAVDDRPGAAGALEGAVLGSRDEMLGVGLERDVVQLRQPSDDDAITREVEALATSAVRRRDGHVCGGTRLHRSPISRPWLSQSSWTSHF
jgi:hypothetical protein